MKTIHGLAYAAGQRVGERTPDLDPASVWGMAQERAHAATPRHARANAHEWAYNRFTFGRDFYTGVLHALLAAATWAGDGARIELIGDYLFDF